MNNKTMINFSNEKDSAILPRLAEHLDYAQKHFDNKWIGIFLQGSQNYGIDTPESDVDTYLIVLPTLDDLIFHREPVSKVVDLPNNEHCVVKDIRLMFDMFRKQNINALEILATRWKIMNPRYEDLFQIIFDHAEQIARYDNYRMVNGILGHLYEKNKKLKRVTPATEALIAKYGYDGKQLCHMDRLYEFFTRFMVNGESFASSLIAKKRDLMLAAKAHAYTLECAEITATSLIEEMELQRRKYEQEHPKHVDKEVDTLLDSVLKKIMLRYVEQELNN